MLVLLDIDGVLVPANSWSKPEIMEDGFVEFTQQAVKAINKIITTTQSDILLTTSHKDNYKLKEWENIFKNRNVAFNNIGKLPKNINHQNRKEEILNWYNNNANTDVFVIIDDDKSLNDLPTILKDKLILTSSSVGLTDYLADEAIANLQKQQHEIV